MYLALKNVEKSTKKIKGRHIDKSKVRIILLQIKMQEDRSSWYNYKSNYKKEQKHRI